MDVKAPTGEIMIDANKWDKFLDEIKFDVFFNVKQTVTITAKDNSNEAVKIEYLVSENKRTEAELAKETFTIYTEPFELSPNHSYIVYVKLTDTSNNSCYISSQGMIFDDIAPDISGIENGKIYCEAQTVTVSEKYIDTVTVNGKAVTLDNNNQFILSSAQGEQKIIATDKAGNSMTLQQRSMMVILAELQLAIQKQFAKFVTRNMVNLIQRTTMVERK